MKWTTERRKISDLIPSEYNPRQATEKQVEDLKKSLDKFDVADPIIINKNNHIIGGHFRYKLLKEKGVDEVDVRVPERELDDKEEKELNIRLNKNLGEWDFGALANFDEELLKDIGFESQELDKIFQLDVPQEDDVPEVSEEEPTAKLGDIYQLGNHRLMCGDATKIDDVKKLTKGENIDLVFTDPPYNVDYKDIKGNFEEIKNDKMDEERFRQFLRDWMVFIPQKSYICCNWQTYNVFFEVLRELKKPVKACIVWDKVTRVQNLDKYYKQHEFILYTGKLGGEKTIRGDVWGLKRQKSDVHPTMKPIELVAMAIKDNPESKKVLDLFGGSGSTLIACEQTNRVCYMMELDPKYIDVIIKRWENFTGNKAKKL